METTRPPLEQLARAALADNETGKGVREVFGELVVRLYRIEINRRLADDSALVVFRSAWHSLLTAPDDDERAADESPRPGEDVEDEKEPPPVRPADIDNTSTKDTRAEDADGTTDNGTAANETTTGSDPGDDKGDESFAAAPRAIGIFDPEDRADRQAGNYRSRKLIASWQAICEDSDQPDLLDYVPLSEDSSQLGPMWLHMHLRLLRIDATSAEKYRDMLAKALSSIHRSSQRDLIPDCPTLRSGKIDLHPADLPEDSLGKPHHQALAGIRPAPRDRYPWLAAAATDLLAIGDTDSQLGVNMFGIKTGTGLQLVDRGLWTRFCGQLVRRLEELMKSETPDDQARSLVRVDEMLANLIPMSLPHRFSWWHKRREALLLRLQTEVRELGGEVQHVGGTVETAGAITEDNVEISGSRGVSAGTILWTLLVPYRKPSHRDLERGRVLYASSRG
jgi:hypothetical protein